MVNCVLGNWNPLWTHFWDEKNTFFSLCEFVLSYTPGIFIKAAVKCADTAQKIHLCSFSHQMLSSLRMRGTSVYEESLTSRLCLSLSKADTPHGHHKPDPSPLHSRELKWEVKSKGKSWGNRGRRSQRPPGKIHQAPRATGKPSYHWTGFREGHGQNGRSCIKSTQRHFSPQAAVCWLSSEG